MQKPARSKKSENITDKIVEDRSSRTISNMLMALDHKVTCLEKSFTTLKKLQKQNKEVAKHDHI